MGWLAHLRDSLPRSYHDSRYPGYITLDDGDIHERRRQRQQRYVRDIRILTDDAEIDNCELYGWPNEALNIGSFSTAVAPYMHHVYLEVEETYHYWYDPHKGLGMVADIVVE